MNIAQAKEQIKNTMTAYFAKDEFGEYLIPEEEQRPVFLIGPPGIGKTAIMQQIAQEFGVGLVSYSMTHHTRQSALGLPFIEKKTFGGKEYRISEYTMSEIIASVYEVMENTGVKGGILFIDEINCVSETLAPSMLQFLQYKVFGSHKVPNGWIVVTAGNPPEYNNSVREFDIVTWDRLKVIEVEPEFSVWTHYAAKKNIHPSITTYLNIKKDNFYLIETTVDGKSYVTARGWNDLSNMIWLMEKNNITVNEMLISQYLRHKGIARDFAIYYDLFNKYKSDYQIKDILSGKVTKQLRERASAAAFDERLSIIGLLLDGLGHEFKSICIAEMALRKYMMFIKELRRNKTDYNGITAEIVRKGLDKYRSDFSAAKLAAGVSADEKATFHRTVKIIEVLEKKLTIDRGSSDDIIRSDFQVRKEGLLEVSPAAGKMLENAFGFVEDCFGIGQEMMIFITELTINPYASSFISKYGSEKYFKYNKEMLLHQRGMQLTAEIAELQLDE
ncbi:ATP-binding protein [Ruminococcus sp. XPD3002]|uniref:ATP-binding protein n=1 Tax=Ruminococcus sp. XPD3002 TaxID=1452269 RepID=UPI0009155B2F|nr:AAA domain (dynein-related subfamily) [Ruminococcus flavefaciens]